MDHASMSDEEIVALVRTKNAELFRVIVQRYQDKLIRYATYIVRNEELAKDAVQDAFIKAYRNLNGFDVKRKFSSWIYRIVHNEVMNAVRTVKHEVRMPEYYDTPGETDLEEEFSEKETAIAVKRCLDSLPLPYREPLALFYLEDRSYIEISDILRIPMGTVATRINRAKKELKRLCQRSMTR